MAELSHSHFHIVRPSRKFPKLSVATIAQPPPTLPHSYRWQLKPPAPIYSHLLFLRPINSSTWANPQNAFPNSRPSEPAARSNTPIYTQIQKSIQSLFVHTTSFSPLPATSP